MDVLVCRIEADEWRDLKTVRLAALLDTPSAFGSTYAAEAGLADEHWRDRARRSSVGDSAAMFFAHVGSRVVGLVGAYRPDDADPGVELVSLWVAPDLRGNAAGRRLVAAVVDWAQTTSAESVQLWVTEGNEAARRLYLSAGFDDAGERQPLPSDPHLDEVRMKRVLSTSPRS